MRDDLLMEAAEAPRASAAMDLPAVLTAVFAVLLLAACGEAGAAPTAEQILLRSLDAAREVNLRAEETVVVSSPASGQVRTLARTVVRSSRGEQLVRWRGERGEPGAIVLEQDGWSRCYDPVTRTVKVTRSAAPTGVQRDKQRRDRRYRLILRNYRVRAEGSAPIAGRDCYVLQLTPHTPLSHLVRLWVDKRTYAVLSHQESNHQGSTVSLSFYTGVQFPPAIPAAAFQNVLPANAPRVNHSRSPILSDLAALRKKAPFEVLVPYAMPAGYEFQHAEIVSVQGRTSTCLRYTDGVGDITLYQTMNPGRKTSTSPGQALEWRNDLNSNCAAFQWGRMEFFLIGRTETGALLAVTRALNNDQERAFLSYFARTYRQPMAALVALRNRGVGTDAMEALLSLQRQTRLPLPKLAAPFLEGHSWSAIARRFKANAGQITRRASLFSCQ